MRRAARSRIWLLVPVVLALETGCAPGHPPEEMVSVRDSAGVSIVTINADPATLPLRSLELEPLRVIEGGADGIPDFVNLGAVRWLSNRWTLVADWGADVMHLFDSNGSLIRTVGRPGDGPGEFREVRSVTVLPGDTAVVYDHPHRRVEVFGPEGEYVRTVRMPGPVSLEAFPLDMYALDAHRFLAQRYRFSDTLLTPGLAIQRSLSFEDLVLFDPAGIILDSTPAVSGRYGAYTSDGDTRAPWSHRPFVAVDRNRIIFGNGERWEMTVRNDSLRPELMIRWPSAEEPLRAEEVEEYSRKVRAAYPPSIPAARVDRSLATIFSPAILPDQRPAIGRVVFDPAGRIWVGRFRPFWWPIPWEPVDWVVLSAEGTPLVRVLLPETMRLEEVRGDTLLVVMTDSLDVEHVAVYRLQRDSN